MILRDPVHGQVSFGGLAGRVMEALLQTREVQRLRRIHMLGLTSLAFPGAEHSRFAHALGTAHVMTRLQTRITEIQDVLPADLRLDDESRADSLAAALLHDIGHGPFSHLFEEVLPDAPHHETWTVEMIQNDETEVHVALEKLSIGMSTRVASLLRDSYRLPYLARAVSGALDVDRFDYLLRDSHMTGVRYGLFDLDWLLQAQVFGSLRQPDGSEAWVLAVENRKGLHPIEDYFLGRHFMYQQVYHHKTTRAAESIIRSIFLRVAELVRNDAPPVALPTALRRAALSERPALTDYLALDDARLMCCFDDWEHARDPVLRDLAGRLRARVLPKTVNLQETEQKDWPMLVERAAELAESCGFHSKLDVSLDAPWDVPYPEPQDESPEGSWTLMESGRMKRTGDVSFLLATLRNIRIQRPRLIVPAALRDEVQGMISEFAQ